MMACVRWCGLPTRCPMYLPHPSRSSVMTTEVPGILDLATLAEYVN